MAYRFVRFPITLNDFEGHSLIARLFKCKSTSIYATFRTDSTDTARHADPRRQLSFRLLLALLAVYAEQGLCTAVRPSVRLSVCPIRPPHVAAAGLLLWARRQVISIDCCTAGGTDVSSRRVLPQDAGSATLSADVGS